MAKKLQKFVPAPPLVGVELNPGPGHASRWNEERRWQIIFKWKDEKKGTRTIAKELGVSRSKVQDLIHKYQETGTIHDRPKPGRKRKLSDTELKKLAKKAKSGEPASVIARHISNSESRKSKSGSKTISDRTVQRRLKESGLKYLVIQEQDQLTPTQIQKRLAYARTRKRFDWTPVLFTDEKTFCLGSGEHKQWQNPENPVTRKKKRHSPKLHVWGGIGHYFKTKLFFFRENLKADLYTKILRLRLPPYYSADCPAKIRGDWIFQHDNDPKHTAGITIKLLDEIAPDRIRDHPPNSPDLNPMEDIWSYLDAEVKKKRIRTIRGLQSALSKAWDNLPWSYVRKSVASMPKRLQEVIALGGERTHY
jgi:Transposase and inactivated derivatives